MPISRKIASVIWITCTLICSNFAAGQVHVSTVGNDENAGTAAAPLATVAKAIAMVSGKQAAQEIIIHGGTYTESDVNVGNRGDTTDAPPQLLIRAARDENGNFEKVIFDGATPITAGEPVDGAPGVYRITSTSMPQAYRALHNAEHDERFYLASQYEYGFWETDTRRRYTYAADATTVAALPCSYAIDFDVNAYRPEVVIHTSDGQPPAAHDLFMARAGVAINVHWPNVTVQGLHFRNFQLRNNSGGIALNGENQTVADCTSWNVGCAVTVGTQGVNARIIRCRGEDLAGGVKSYGQHTIVEDCVFIRDNGPFEIRDYSQNQQGVHVYYPGEGAEIRRNVLVGFQGGIFIKANSGRYVFEYNTVIAGNQPIARLGIASTRMHHPENVCRYNIVSGYSEIMLRRSELYGAGLTHDFNCFWDTGEWGELLGTLKRLQHSGTGAHNVVADPGFINAAAGDYRLTPQSPCATMAPGGKPIGALPVVADAADVTPPRVDVAASVPAVRHGKTVIVTSETDPWRPGGGAISEIDRYREEAAGNVWITPSRKVALQIAGSDAGGVVTQMQLKIGDADWSKPQPWTTAVDIQLPEGKAETVIHTRLADKAGNWSAPTSIAFVIAADAPALVGEPRIAANQHGAIVAFTTSVPCRSSLKYGSDGAMGNIIAHRDDVERQWNSGLGAEIIETRTGLRYEHRFALAAPDVEPGGTLHWRLILDDGVGHKTTTDTHATNLTGEPRTLYVAMNGTDAEDAGSADAPWASLQYAVDRALPGDRIVVKKGIYLGKFVLNHGGAPGAPITLAAESPGAAILDGMKARGDQAIIRLESAPYVVIDGFEIRWFAAAGIYIDRSAGVEVRHCDIWNAHITKGRWEGLGLFARRSPDMQVHHNTFYSCNRMFTAVQCDNLTLSHNTISRMLHGSMTIAYSDHFTSQHNSFNFAGSYSYEVVMTRDQFDTFTSDYNNFANHIVSSRWTDQLAEAEKIERQRYGSDGKALSVRYVDGVQHLAQGLAYWQQTTGHDKHSLWAEPMFVEPKQRDFRLQPDSPNLGAGRDGAHIGAMGPASP